VKFIQPAMNNKKMIKIGFDMDGVLVNKPPLIPKKWLEYLFQGRRENGLHYRYPKTELEIWLRKFSHFYLFRPPIKKNIEIAKEFKKQGYKLYLISSRYSFLKKETMAWLKRRKLDNVFEEIFINLNNEQPHIFKEKIIRQLDLDYYFDDDRNTVDFLQLKFKDKIFWVKQRETVCLKNDKKKILFSLTYYEPNISGVTICVKRLAEGMAERGHQVTVLSSWYKDALPQREKKNGVRILREKVHFRLGKGVFMLGLPITAWREVKKHDVVNCHLPQFESFVFAIIAKIQKKKLVLSYHVDLWGSSGLINFISELAINTVQFISSLLVDEIVVYTKDYADHSPFLKYFKKKIIVIRPPVISQKPSEQYTALLKQRLKGVGFKIGYSGRIVEKKGIPSLLRTIPYLRKELGFFKIIFAGPGKEVVGENYPCKIRNLLNKYKDFLVFLGSLSQPQLSSFYRLIDILVLASEKESFGLVQVEAMFSGCPVVVSNLPGARDPVEKTGAGEIVPVGNPRQLAQAIIKVLKNKRRYRQKTLKAKKIFNYQKTLDQYERVFAL